MWPRVFWSGGLDSNQRPLDPQSKDNNMRRRFTCCFVFYPMSLTLIFHHFTTLTVGTCWYDFLHAHERGHGSSTLAERIIARIEIVGI